MRGKKEVKRKNSAIEFWRFFFAIAITGYHIGFIFPMAYVNQDTGYYLSSSNWMRGAGEILFVFTLTAGYFLVKHFKRLQANEDYQKRSASSRAWEYLWGRIKGLLPVLILGIVLGIIALSAFSGTSIGEVFVEAVNGIWEFFGLYIAGFSGSAASGQPNGALWFISALLICSYFIYWILCKNEDLLSGFIAPFTFVFLGGWWALTGTRASQTGWSTLGVQVLANNATSGTAAQGTAFIGFNNGLLFVLLGMLGGVLIYYLVERLKKVKFSSVGKTALTVLYLFVAIFLVWYTVYPDTVLHLERWTVHFLCMLLVALTLLRVDAISMLLDNDYTNKAISYLGGCALYIYMIHIPIVYMVLMMLGKNTLLTSYTWSQVFWPTIIISTFLGVILKYVMDRFVIHRKS